MKRTVLNLFCLLWLACGNSCCRRESLVVVSDPKAGFYTFNDENDERGNTIYVLVRESRKRARRVKKEAGKPEKIECEEENFSGFYTVGRGESPNTAAKIISDKLGIKLACEDFARIYHDFYHCKPGTAKCYLWAGDMLPLARLNQFIERKSAVKKAEPIVEEVEEPESEDSGVEVQFLSTARKRALAGAENGDDP